MPAVWGVSGLVVGEDQPVEVEIPTVVDVSLDPVVADFGSVVPGGTEEIVVTVDNSGSNVEITVESVALQTGGNLLDDLLFNGELAGDFVALPVVAGGSDTITLSLTIPAGTAPTTVSDVIVYTITPPEPA